LTPTFKAKRRHIRIDTSVSWDAFGCPLDEIFARPAPRAAKGEQYGASVTTNGQYVSFHYKVPSKGAAATKSKAKGKKAAAAAVPVPPTAPIARGTVVIGVDLGNINPIAASKTVTSSDGSTRKVSFVYSKTEWEHDTGLQERTQNSHAWCEGLRAKGGVFEKLSTVTHKTASLDRFVEYARVFAATRDELLEERMKPRWAHAAFRKWQLSHRAVDRAWSSLLAGRLEDGDYGARVVLGLGDASFPSSGRGRRPTPTTALVRAAYVAASAVQRVSHVVMRVFEYGSTKYHMDGGCGATLAQVWAPPSARQVAKHDAKVARSEEAPQVMVWGWTRAPPPPPRELRGWYPLHGLQWCDHDDCKAPHARLVARDPDAAVGIADATARCIAGAPPPPSMVRGWDGGERPPHLFLQR